MVTDTPSSEGSPKAPAIGSDLALPEWVSLRNSALPPRVMSGFGVSDVDREEFLGGARALGLLGGSKTLKPQQLVMVDVLNAGCKFNSILWPRRSSKTTTLLAWMIGRGLAKPDYRMAYVMMTNAKKSRDRFLSDVVKPLERMFPDKDSRPFVIGLGKGSERVTFTNGALLQFLGPKGSELRSDAYDLLVLDESGEAGPEDGEDVITAALPTMDTRPGAQVVFAGTAGKYRKGNLLHDELEKGRAGMPRHGIVEYAVEDQEFADDVTWEEIEPLVLDSHPGIGTLTTLEDVHDNFDNLGIERFAAEYLGVFGRIGVAVTVINMKRWEAGTRDEDKPQPPARFAMAIVVHPLQLFSAIVAAWRVEDVAYILVLDHRPGLTWFKPKVKDLARKYPKLPIGHDSQGAVMVEVSALGRTRPRLNLVPRNTANIITAAGLLVKEVDEGNVEHWGQDVLTNAATIARRRDIGEKQWALGRPKGEDEADIIALEGGSIALELYDSWKWPNRIMPSEDEK